MEAQLVVGLTVDVVSEDVAQPFLSHVDARQHHVVAVEWGLELQVHPCHDWVHVFFLVQFGVANAKAVDEAVACVLCVVEVVGIVHDAFDVALVVAHLHARGE